MEDRDGSRRIFGPDEAAGPIFQQLWIVLARASTCNELSGLPAEAMPKVESLNAPDAPLRCRSVAFAGDDGKGERVGLIAASQGQKHVDGQQVEIGVGVRVGPDRVDQADGIVRPSGA